MAGMLIVEDEPDKASPDLLAMDDVVAIVQGIYLANNTADPITLYSNIWATASNGGTSTLNLNLQNPFNIARNVLVVNGQYKPTLDIQPGEIKRIRMLNALSTDSLYIGFPSGAPCTMTVLALDGVYLSNPREETAIYMPPAARADIAVRCTGTGTFAISTLENDASWFKLLQGVWTSGTAIPGDNQDILLFQVQGDQMYMNMPTTMQPKPHYLSDLTSVDSSAITDRWSLQYSDANGTMTINGLPFNGSAPQHTMQLGGISEWYLTSGQPYRNGTGIMQHPHHQVMYTLSFHYFSFVRLRDFWLTNLFLEKKMHSLPKQKSLSENIEREERWTIDSLFKSHTPQLIFVL